MGRYGPTVAPALSRDVPPNRATPTSAEIPHCAGTERRVRFHFMARLSQPFVALFSPFTIQL